MKVSQSGIDLIKKFEGCRLTAYKADPSEKYYTIGYGHYAPDIKKDMKITKLQAEGYLKTDLAKFEKCVNNLGKKWTQNEFDALVSFCYNCGEGNLRKLIANRDNLQIADAFLYYNKCNGKILNGLTKRRKAERELFLTNNLESIAREVIEGKWGNGRIRKENLTAAGYDYCAVQIIVNRIITGG